MLHHSAEHQAVARIADLEAAVSAVEERLQALSEALRGRDAPAVELQADGLHQALEHAVHLFIHAARDGGGVPSALRLRLSKASAQVARQREVLARATAALDRAIDLLLPDVAGAGRVYTANGQSRSLSRGGSLSA